MDARPGFAGGTHPVDARPVLVVGTHSVHVRRFVAALCEAGRDVVLVTTAQEPLVDHPRLREQLCLSLRVADWRAPGRIRDLIRRWQPSVVHVHQADASAWHAVRAARPTGVPVVLTLWGSDVLTLPQRGAWQRAMVRHALRGAAAWTADAQVLLRAAQALVPEDPPAWREWIPIGIDEPPAGPELLDLPRERRILSCRLHKPLYRIDAIVRAFAAAAPALPGWVLEVAGSGEQTPALRELAATLGVEERVEFTGHLNAADLARAYRRSALFVSVPRSDGTSVSLLEAMAAGCLPVLADLPANREWVRDEVNGVIVEADVAGGLVPNLAQAMERAAAWWEGQGPDVPAAPWRTVALPANQALIAERATLRANIRQFMALHGRVGSSQGPVVHLTTVHPRHDIRIFRKECVSLAASGREVVLVVGDGLGDAVEQGVRLLDIGARPPGRLARMRQQPRRALALARRLRPALVHLHDPELLPVGVALAREGIPVVYDAHEDVPRQILTKQWIPAALRPLLSRAFEFYENRQVRRLAAVVAATPHIAQRFAAVAPRSVAVENYPHLNELALGPATATATPTPPRERAVCYVGGIFRTRGALQMVRAVAQVPGLKLLLCGGFEDAAIERELRAEPGWARVEYLGVVGREQVREVMARSQAGLVTLLPLPSYLDALPIKMFEYMSASLPVVASDFPLWRGIVERHGCGLCVDPSDPAAIAAALARLLDDPAEAQGMGQAGREAVTAHYHWPAAEVRLLELYEALIGPP